MSIDFQRYTGHGPQYLEAVHEVEFNLYMYPESRGPVVPALSVEQFLMGADQTQAHRGYRLHVPCDNPNAVKAGVGLFGEPKYLAAFDYTAPTLNDPTVTSWTYSVYQAPAQQGGADGPLLWTTTADLLGLTAVPANASPLIEYGYPADANGITRAVANFWSFYGPFETFLFAGNGADRARTHGATPPRTTRHTVNDLIALIGDRSPVAAQMFASPPPSAENRGWFTVPIGS